ncbi:uncharacterized protein LOC128676537 [Plodia interpunctella]|uniref:uncharacterized protein LOC128676537 n=1 Tax=Plodia interpunctella TaxID=58824 RepID=UPI0023684642|nr:uncharacterized protein LOC128676537 [Plodia interpunctella]
MKKVSPTPKEIAKKRLARSKFMKIPLCERNIIDNKENLIPEIKIKKSTFRKKDRMIKDFSPRNPFDVPQIDRVFSKCKKAKKQKPEPDLTFDVHTVRDFDDTFFNIIEGRPLRRSDDIKVYMNNIRDMCLFKANTAYLLDKIVHMETSYATEMKEYEKIVKMYKEIKDGFSQFIGANYHSSKKYQMIASVSALAAQRKSEQLSIICDEYVVLRNRLQDIFASFEKLSRYRQFLDNLTPIWWLTEQRGASDSLFEAAARNASPRVSFTSSESLGGNKKKLSIKKVDSRQFFVDPKQIVEIFEDMRRQCLHYMHEAGISNNIISIVLKEKESLKRIIEDEEKGMEGYIERYNYLIKFEEEKEIAYKKLFEKILLKEFQQLISSFDVCKLFTCLQYVNVKVFDNTEDPRDNISTLMFNIESSYMDVLLKLDYLDNEIVRKATKQAFDEDIAKMKRAYKAQRIIKESDILRKSLYDSFEPPRTRILKNVTNKK